jgi:hypothetical protein
MCVVRGHGNLLCNAADPRPTVDPEKDMTRTALRAGGAIGIAHIVVAMIGFTLQNSKGIDITLAADKANLTAFFVDGDAGTTFLGGYLELFGFLLFVPFAAALYQLLRSGEGSGGFGAMTSGLAATIFIATTLAPGFSAGAAALWMGTHGGDLAAVEVLNQLRNTTYATSLAAYALFFAAVGISALLGGSLPKWLSLSALAIGGWLAVGVAFFADGQADLPGMVGLLWILAAGIWMLRGRIRHGGGAAPASSAEAVSVG